ncbi:MAG: hydrogenase 3 maturation endopeptidase HyCI [Candidatus Bathyarchaeota archaeon]|nr:hydrogenase 3 maturation endopeptidase HyCI [Candidatus Bathyarchaeota archaeon]
MTGDIAKELYDWFTDSKKIVIVGIGNPIRLDDNVGLKIVESLQNKVNSNVCLFECEMVPEDYLLDIEEFNPSHVLLVDAAKLGLKAGETKLVKLTDVPGFSVVSSHILPLRLFCEYIQKTTKAKIRLLLVEPKTTEFGEGLSEEVQATAEKLTKLLIDFLG